MKDARAAGSKWTGTPAWESAGRKPGLCGNYSPFELIFGDYRLQIRSLRLTLYSFPKPFTDAPRDAADLEHLMRARGKSERRLPRTEVISTFPLLQRLCVLAAGTGFKILCRQLPLYRFEKFENSLSTAEKIAFAFSAVSEGKSLRFFISRRSRQRALQTAPFLYFNPAAAKAASRRFEI